MAATKHAQVVARPLGGAHAPHQGIVHQSSTPEETTGPAEESEEVWGQPDPSRYTVGMSLNQTGKTQEAPHVTGAHDTQWSDLTTEETVALVELVNSFSMLDITY